MLVALVVERGHSTRPLVLNGMFAKRMDGKSCSPQDVHGRKTQRSSSQADSELALVINS